MGQSDSAMISEWLITVTIEGESEEVFVGWGRRDGPASIDLIVEMARKSLVDRYSEADAPRLCTVFGEINGYRAMWGPALLNPNGVIAEVQRLAHHLLQASTQDGRRPEQ